MPAGPAPTTTTRPAWRARGTGGRRSRPTSGLTAHEIASPNWSIPAHAWTVEMQGRIVSARPAAALATQSGSAIRARPRATASQSPRRRAASAASGRTIRPTPTTGIATARRTRAAAPRKIPSGSSSSGIE